MISSEDGDDAGAFDPGRGQVGVEPASPDCASGPELAPGLHASGGAAAITGQGGRAGDVTLVAGGDILYRPAGNSSDPAEIEVPLGGVEISAADLIEDVDMADTIRVRGLVQSSGGDRVRRIRSTGGDIVIEGRLLAGPSTEGPAQSLRLEAPGGTVFVLGTVDSGAQVSYAATAGGTIEIDADSVVIDGGMVRTAGAGPCSTIGGPGGAISITAHSGAIVVRDGTVDSRGASAIEGDGGRAGPITLSADGRIEITGQIVARGGHGQGAGGGTGATLLVDVVGQTGSFAVEDGFVVDLAGGGAERARAGNGGVVEGRTIDGNITIAGLLSARGGEGNGDGSRGGPGGGVYLWTDKNANGIGGDLTVAMSGVIDTSGGGGATGGSGRNNGGHGTGNFPDELDQISVLLNSETIGGPPRDGRLQNLGVIVSQGGAANGWGGDVIFHGRRPAGEEDPEPGNLLLDGHGGGENGDSAME